MSLLKKEPTKAEGEEKVTTTVTTSPKPPPPKAPSTFASDPSSQIRLGGRFQWGRFQRKGPRMRSQRKDPKGDSKGVR